MRSSDPIEIQEWSRGDDPSVDAVLDDLAYEHYEWRDLDELTWSAIGAAEDEMTQEDT